MAENKCNYKLKGKYNGVYGYTNDKLTDKKAEKLVKEHARGYDLFAVLPVDIQNGIDERLAIEQKKIESDKVKARESLLDKQLRAEEEAKKLIRKEAIAKEELEAKEKIKAHKEKLALRTKTKK